MVKPMNTSSVAPTVRPGDRLNKAPEVTPGVWIITVAATTPVRVAMVFGGLLALVAVAYCRTRPSHALSFRIAAIPTRPLAAVVAGFLDQPVKAGGLAVPAACRAGGALTVSEAVGSWP